MVAVATLRPSIFMQELQQGNNNLLPTTEEGIYRMLSMAVYYKDRIPRSRQVHAIA